MPIVTVIGRRWWFFPLALAVTLVLITAVAAADVGAATAQEPAAPLAASGFAGAAQAFLGLGALFLVAAFLMLVLGWRDPRPRDGAPRR